MRGAVIGGRYRLHEEIGRGGMAVVYRATDASLGRDVAVKILKPEFAEQQDFVEAFRREAHSAARLQHPHIVQIYDTGVDEGVYYIVMEFMPEPNFKEILRQYAPLPLHKALEVAIQTCEALEYAHNHEMVHRDIKPHNILFTREGIAKVADFGIACPPGAPGRIREGLVVGSAHYISPEQAQGNPATPLSDLYSLGVILYEALTGRVPFDAQTPEEIAARHLRERPRSPRALNPSITPSAEYVVMKALAKDPQRRYQSGADMLLDLRKLAAGMRLEQTGVLPAPTATEGVELGATTVVRGAREGWATVPIGAPKLPSAAPRPVRPARAAAPAAGEGSSLWLGIAAFAAALLILVGVAYGFWRVMYPNVPVRKVQVPSLIGVSQAEARAELARQGLTLGQTTEEEDATRRPGTVTAQNPEMGTFVEEHSAVDVVIAKGSDFVIVPSVVGELVEEAEQKLREAKVVPGDETRQHDEQMAEGYVIEQRIAAGTRVRAGMPVDLVVSLGPQPDTAIPPPANAVGEAGGPGPAGMGRATVQMERKSGYTPSEPDEDRITVRVLLAGQQKGQQVEVFSVDARGTRLVHHAQANGGEVVECEVAIKGRTTIEVKVEQEKVAEQEFPLAAGGGQ